MVVFGIDPGSTVTGYGVVATERGRMRLVAAGAIRTSSDDPMDQRLLRIYRGLLAALDAQPLDAVAIEAVFRHKSSESALRLGQARGVALLAAAERGYAPFEYNAMTVKRTVGAHGAADKQAIARMVRMLLGEVPAGPADLTDALAIAITHCSHARNRMLAGDRR
jgi:crossover junction endodeoxyribonuclease RuvC